MRDILEAIHKKLEKECGPWPIKPVVFYPKEKKYPEDLRLIEFYAAEKDEVITFMTNNFELGSLDIANIYRNCWQIETFFKWIKGNLTIKALWEYSENDVKIHIWV